MRVYGLGDQKMPATRVTSESPWHTVLLIDDSGSMEGQPAADVSLGLETMLSEMAMLAGGNKKPYFKVSIIKFGSHVTQMAAAKSPADLEGQLGSFLGDGGTTNMAGAFQEAENVLRANPGQATDFQPWVFLFSDGRPDDVNAAVAAAQSLKSMQLPAGAPYVMAFGFGAVDDGLMQQVCSNREAFKRISSSTDLLTIMPQIGTVARTAANASQLQQGIQTF